MKEAEQKLIEGLKAGEENAFDSLMEAYGTRLYSFASRMCRNGEDAKDIVQETLIAVFRSVKDFRGECGFPTWLFKIAANSCRKMRRKSKFEPKEELSLDEVIPQARHQGREPAIADWSEDPEKLLLRGELKTTVETAIGELPGKYRSVLVLRDMEQFSTTDTAEILGLSPEAVKSRLHRARLFVRQRLAQYVQVRNTSAAPASGRRM